MKLVRIINVHVLRLRFYLAQWELLECLIADARNFIAALESQFMALVNSFLRLEIMRFLQF